MIDLHMHTIYSDGTDSVEELLKKANALNLDIISITDHDSCDAYYELEKYNVNDYYKGKIIVGCEFTTSFDGRLIEVLGYGIDYKKVNEFLSVYYSSENKHKTKTILYNRLVDRINDLGLKPSIKPEKEKDIKDLFVSPLYEELIKYPENKHLLKEDIWDSFADFFRKGLTNPNSKLFINYAEFKPLLKDIINVIHDAGGLVFLAHPYAYKFSDTESFLDRIYDEYNLDGIECFYTTFTKEQTAYVLDFAQKRNLLISGGSDYHGTNKKNHDLGTGNNNLNIKNDIVDNWNVDYLK